MVSGCIRLVLFFPFLRIRRVVCRHSPRAVLIGNNRQQKCDSNGVGKKEAPAHKYNYYFLVPLSRYSLCVSPQSIVPCSVCACFLHSRQNTHIYTNSHNPYLNSLICIYHPSNLYSYKYIYLYLCTTFICTFAITRWGFLVSFLKITWSARRYCGCCFWRCHYSRVAGVAAVGDNTGWHWLMQQAVMCLYSV